MLKESVINPVRKYLTAVKEAGISVEFAVVFGSQVKCTQHPWSDIDVLVVSPLFDEMSGRGYINVLWHIAAYVDSRIEPIPCGLEQWQSDNLTTIIEVARREGEILSAA